MTDLERIKAYAFHGLRLVAVSAEGFLAGRSFTGFLDGTGHHMQCPSPALALIFLYRANGQGSTFMASFNLHSLPKARPPHIINI